MKDAMITLERALEMGRLAKQGWIVLAGLLSQQAIGQEQLGTDLAGMRSTACSANGLVVAGGWWLHTDAEEYQGKAMVMQWQDSVWIPKGLEVLGDGWHDYFGRSVALSSDGNTLVVGASQEGAGSSSWHGYVKVFIWSGGQWVQAGQTIADGALNQLGQHVAVSNDGRTFIAGSSGAYAKVFSYDSLAQDWVQLGAPIPGDPNSCGGGDGTGHSVAINGDGTIVIVGSTDYDAGNDCFDNSGKARVFDWDGSQWVQRGGTLFGSANQRFGHAVSITDAGDKVVVGGPTPYGGSNRGIVRTFIYDQNASDWTEVLPALIGDLGDRMGSSIALDASGQYLAVGSTEDSSTDPGHIDRYSFQNGSWAMDGTPVVGGMPWNSGAGDRWNLALSASGQIMSTGSRAPGGGNQMVRVFTYCLDTLVWDTTSCQPILVGDQEVSTDTVGSFFMLDPWGCPQVIELDATVDVLDTTVVQEQLQLTAQQDNATYQWIDCLTGQPIANANAQTFVPASDGNYAVQVTVGNCSETSGCHLVLGTPVQETASWSEQMIIWPNPTSGALTIKLPAAWPAAPYQLVNATGQVVRQLQLQRGLQQVDLDLPAGFYVMRNANDALVPAQILIIQ